MSSIRPLGDRVIVERDEAETQTPSGLYIPEDKQDRPQRGTVQAVGEGLLDNNGKLHELRVKAGDRVVFSKYAGNEIEIGDEKFFILKEGDIFGVIEE